MLEMKLSCELSQETIGRGGIVCLQEGFDVSRDLS